MKQIIIVFSCIYFFLTVSYGQYSGGGGKGVIKVGLSTNLGTNIFIGGANDGFVKLQFVANLGSNIYKGGTGDATDRLAATTNLGTNIFKGGSSDGEAFSAGALNLGTNIFAGGSGDGEARIASTLNFGNNIFKGGVGDGWEKVAISILLTPAVYTFTGNGLWTNSGNWFNNIVPPPVLPSAFKIVINHAAGGQCILNTSQTIEQGGILLVNPNKSLLIQGDLKSP